MEDVFSSKELQDVLDFLLQANQQEETIDDVVLRIRLEQTEREEQCAPLFTQG